MTDLRSELLAVLNDTCYGETVLLGWGDTDDILNNIWPTIQPILQAFIDAKEGVNSSGVYWNTKRLRDAYTLTEQALGLPVTQPQKHKNEPYEDEGVM